MQGRQNDAAHHRLGLRLLAGGIALAVGGAIALALAPASSAQTVKTVNAELSLSGISTTANVLGGSQIGVHPGDTVNFMPSTVPTAGLSNIPVLGTALDSLLQSLLGTATGYQITVHFPATFPGGKRDVTMGACSKTKNLAVTFPKDGNYDFTWSAVAISPLCLLPSNLGSLAGNQLKNAGIALNASNQWVGRIAVGENVSPGGISIQLPGVSIAPSLPVVGQLPTVGVPGLNLPTLGVTVPGTGGGSSGSTSPTGGYKYTPPATTVPQMVVPHPQDGNGNGGGVGLGNFGGDLPSVSVPSSAPSGAPGAVHSSAAASASKKPANHAKLASTNKLSTAQVPALLAIIAILALSLVTGTYARLYLMRRGA